MRLKYLITSAVCCLILAPSLAYSLPTYADPGAESAPQPDPVAGTTVTFIPKGRESECKNRFDILEACRRDNPTWVPCAWGLCPPPGQDKPTDSRCDVRGCDRLVQCTLFTEGAGWITGVLRGANGLIECAQAITYYNRIEGLGREDLPLPGPKIIFEPIGVAVKIVGMEILEDSIKNEIIDQIKDEFKEPPPVGIARD